MKLTYKLTLAFLFVSLIAIGLAALFVWATTAAEFNKYIVDQRQAQFISVATDYYRTHGNWRGVDVALREQGLLPPLPQPGTRPPDPQPFALVDQDRTVIIPGGDYRPGQKIQKGVLVISCVWLCVQDMARGGVFPLADGLPSSPSAPPTAGLFGTFSGTTPSSDCLSSFILSVYP